MKRFFTLMLLVASMCAVAQEIVNDEYHQLYQLYQNEYGTSSAEMEEQMKQSLMATTQISPDPQLAEAVEKYCSQQMMNDLLDLLEPYYRNHVTLEDLKTMMEWESAHPHYSELLKEDRQIFTTTEGQALIEEMSSDIVLIAQGKKVKAVKPLKQIPASYIEAYDAFWNGSSTKDMLDGVMQGITAQIGDVASLSEKDKKQIDKLFANMTDYLFGTFRNKYLNLLYSKGRTEEDLRLYGEYRSLPAKQHETEAGIELMNNALDFSRGLMTRFMDWAEPQYPATISSVRMGFNMALGAGNQAEE